MASKRLDSRRDFLKYTTATGAAALMPKVKVFGLEGNEKSGFSVIDSRMPELTRYVLQDYRYPDLDSTVNAVENGALKDGRLDRVDVYLNVARDYCKKDPERNFDVQDGDRIKKEVWGMANMVLTNLKNRERSDGRLSSRNVMEELNKVFYGRKNFRFPGKTDFFSNLFSDKTTTFDQMWDGETGICEDLTGAYMSVVGVLKKAGVKANIEPVVMPSHICVRSVDGDTVTYNELTLDEEPRIMGEREYLRHLREKRGLDFQSLPDIASDIANCANSFSKRGDYDNAFWFYRQVHRLGETPFFLSIHADKLLERGEGTDLMDASVLLDKAGRLDPGERMVNKSKAKYHLLLAEKSKTRQVKLQNIDAALREYDGMFGKRTYNAAFADKDDWVHICKSDAYLKRYDVGGDPADILNATSSLTKAEQLGSHNLSRKRAKLYIEYYKSTGMQREDILNDAVKEFGVDVRLYEEGKRYSPAPHFLYRERAHALRLAGRLDEAGKDLSKALGIDDVEDGDRGFLHIERGFFQNQTIQGIRFKKLRSAS